MKRPRYQFAEFRVSPSQRRVLRGGLEVPLIPRYFELLLLLLERRPEAVSRRTILDEVWSDVIVTDNALNQAIRTLRQLLGDDPRAPRFIATVPRHGYRFVHPDVTEVDDTGEFASEGSAAPPLGGGDALEEALGALLRSSEIVDPQRRAAAERIHTLGLEEGLARLGRRPGHESARALLRDARWALTHAAPVPIWGTPGALRTTLVLIRLRLHRALSIAGRRWACAALGGACAGLLAGAVGALLLRLGPGASTGNAALVALPVIGLAIGGAGAVGVGGGLAFAEAVFRAWRGLALVLCGAIGGGMVGGLAHGVASALLESLFGTGLSTVAGGTEGLAIGAATGAGYALATPTRDGGMASPRGGRRLTTGLIVGIACAATTSALAWSGHFLGAMSLDLLTQSFPASQVGLTPIGNLLGEVPPGRVTAVAVSAWEGLCFGTGVGIGLTHRPRSIGSAGAEEA